MSADEKTINTFATRVRQLILEFGKLKQENAELYEMVDERDAQIKALQEKLSQAEHDYNSLKMAKMMTISDADMEATQKRVAKLISDVKKWITLLSNHKVGAMADQEQEKLLIRLHIYDTDLSVKIPREDEEYYRKSGKLINDIVNSYSKIFKGRKSDKEILYMSLLDIALRYEKESGRNDTAPYHDILTRLTAEIEDTLK